MSFTAGTATMSSSATTRATNSTAAPTPTTSTATAATTTWTAAAAATFSADSRATTSCRGGRGADAFFFETKLNAKKNFDKILDFAPGDDEMRLDNDIFAGTGKTGHSLKGSKFEVGNEATSSATRILYNENKGIVYYTPHGDDGKQTKFVKVTKGIDLDHDDFFIIA